MAIMRSIVWPLMTTHIKQYCLSCENCQRMARSGPRRAPMISRQIKSIPFEDVAIDLVGPFERGRGGCRYLLTYICMASRWPEAIPLKSVTARAVPLQMPSDQSTQLTGAKLCAILGVVKIRTTPYRPQSNGVVECLHGTLVPMRLGRLSRKSWTG